MNKTTKKALNSINKELKNIVTLHLSEKPQKPREIFHAIEDTIGCTLKETPGSITTIVEGCLAKQGVAESYLHSKDKTKYLTRTDFGNSVIAPLAAFSLQRSVDFGYSVSDFLGRQYGNKGPAVAAEIMLYASNLGEIDNISEVDRRLGIRSADAYLKKWVSNGFAKCEDKRYSLTEKGHNVLDKFILPLTQNYVKTLSDSRNTLDELLHDRDAFSNLCREAYKLDNRKYASQVDTKSNIAKYLLENPGVFREDLRNELHIPVTSLNSTLRDMGVLDKGKLGLYLYGE